MRRLLVSLLALVAVAGAAACGDDGGSDEGLSSEEQEFADAWATTLSDEDEDDPSGLSFPPGEAQCMGDAIMAEVGTGPFDEAGLEPADINKEGEDDSPGELLGAGAITDEQADAILTQWDDCTDLNAAFVDLVASETDFDDAARACIEEGLAEEDLVHDGFRSSLTRDDSEPPSEVITALISLMTTCGGDESGQGGPIVDSIAESLAADGRLDAAQSQCIAQEMVDAIGVERLVELGVGGGAFEEADPGVQQEIAGAVLGAADACGVPLSALGG